MQESNVHWMYATEGLFEAPGNESYNIVSMPVPSGQPLKGSSNISISGPQSDLEGLE